MTLQYFQKTIQSTGSQSKIHKNQITFLSSSSVTVIKTVSPDKQWAGECRSVAGRRSISSIAGVTGACFQPSLRLPVPSCDYRKNRTQTHWPTDTCKKGCASTPSVWNVIVAHTSLHNQRFYCSFLVRWGDYNTTFQMDFIWYSEINPSTLWCPHLPRESLYC